MYANRIRSLALIAMLASLSLSSQALTVSVTNLVTDDPAANPAAITDSGLVNAWGISYSPAGPFWVSSNGAATSTVYRVDPLTQATVKSALTVAIPGAGNVTGQVFNPGGASQLHGDNFLFVSEDGTVSGWRSALGTSAETLNSLSAIYKGAAYGNDGTNSYLYAADFHGGTINVFKGNAAAPVLSGNFTDPTLPAGYAPFNVQNLNDSLFVAYAKQDSASPDEVAGAGLGYVDQFDLQGHFVARVAGGGALNAPWGMAIAPDTFGELAGSLLVGNFGDGRINAYDLNSHALLGQLTGPDGHPLSIDGLWGLSVGNDGLAGSSHVLYFTAGPGDERHGLFGVIQSVPEPGAGMLFGGGLLGLFWLVGRSRR
jgi:uncharacterized protein (TIGR03118 family)